MFKIQQALLPKSAVFVAVLACAAPLAAFAAHTGTTGPSGSAPTMGHTGKTTGSPWIKSIQAALNRKEHAHLAVDGKMGRETEIALKKFQQTHGLKPTGHPNKATDHALGM